MKKNWLFSLFLLVVLRLHAQSVHDLQLVSKEVDYTKLVRKNDITVYFKKETGSIEIKKGDTLIQEMTSVNAAEFLDDNFLIISKMGNKENVIVYDIAKNQFFPTEIKAPLLMSLACNKANNYVLASDRQFGQVLVLDFYKNSVVLLDRYPRFCFFVGAFPDGSMASVGTSDAYNPAAHEIRFYSRDGKVAAKSGVALEKMNPDLNLFYTSVVGNEVLVASPFKKEFVSYRLDGNKVASTKLKGISQLFGSFSLDGELVYVGSHEKAIVIYDTSFAPLKSLACKAMEQGYQVANVEIKGNELLVFYYERPR